MIQRNDGTGESNILQNQFTAYLIKAVRGRKADYLQKKSKWKKHEVSMEEQTPEYDSHAETDFDRFLPTMDQLENHKLQQLLSGKSKRDLYIFFAKILEDRSFVEIAAELGLKYTAVSESYYRTVRKIRKELGGEDS